MQFSRRALSALVLLSAIAAGCTAPVAPSEVPATESPLSPFISGSPPIPETLPPSPPPAQAPSPTPAPSETEGATPVRTLPALPDAYQTALLNPKDAPRAYLADTCQYLHDKWDPANAAPGTVAMTVMFHSVTRDEVTHDNQISFDQFDELMEGLKANGFEAINTTQLADFLEHNARIPPRSVLLVADDRHYAAYFNHLFLPYYEEYGWPVVNAWISATDTPARLWQENVDLEDERWVDHQAHGVVHNIPAGPGSTDEYLLGELQGSVDAFLEHFGKRPIAYIWPGGGFTPRSVELARGAGYRLGFTVNPRGPVMFNWVPQAAARDDMRPSYIPEGPAADPLLTLPRYWDTDALIHLDAVAQIGDEAAAYATQNKATELAYYDIACAETYGPLPAD